MALGDKAAAFALIEQSMAAFPVEKDAMGGPTKIEVQSRVAAYTGEHDRAIPLLQRLLSIYLMKVR
jgi:hypothetical protein